jgi:hypothetical protein
MSRLTSITVHPVFEFSQDETDFWPSKQFSADLTASHCPFIIMFVGNGRVGKSTRLNQLLLHKLKSDIPFKACSGVDPVTMKFQYVGPLKLQDLAEIHNIDLQIESDPDIFFIDCEGLHSLGNTTAVLKQATFALSQMASMTILVMKEQVNLENIENVRSLFVLSHAFSRQLPGFSIGTTIMMRDIGIRRERGQELTLDEKNHLRQKCDEEQRTKIMKILNDNLIAFSETDFLVLAQPQFDDSDLYWKSIEDFLNFMLLIAVKRGHISGQALLQLFEEAKPSIMQITDFSNPSIPFSQIMQNITDRYLKEASSTANSGGEEDIKKLLIELKSDNLRRGLDVQFVGDIIVKWISIFEAKSEELFPHLLEYSPEQTEQYRELIRNQIETTSNQLFVKRCIDVLLPEIESEIIEGIKQDIEQEMNEIPVANLGCFPFTTLSSRQEQEGESRFNRSVMMIHPDIPKSQKFRKLIAQLRADISEYMKDIETAKRHQYAEYLREEQTREKDARDAKYQKDFEKLGKEEAEKRLKLEEERDAAERRRNEEEQRSKMERKQNQVLMKEQIEQQKKHNAAIREMQERSNRERDELFQKMMDERRESEARLAAQRQEEQRLQAEREQRLQEQIVQLQSRPPTIIREGGGGFCNVC